RTMDELGIPQAWRPIGWWTTMDPDMLPLRKPLLPVTPRLTTRAPFVRLRYTAPSSRRHDAGGGATSATPATTASAAPAPSLSRKQQIGAWARAHGLSEALDPYRPYELFAPGALRPDVIEAGRSAGLRYVFSKAGFGAPPRVLALSHDFIAMNYTVGRWDGWTPFETINDIGDVRSAERRLLARHQPGWLVGTFDSCLWTFTGPVWQRGAALHQIATMLASGGDSGQLINVTPRVVARYARIIAETDPREK
ncbi:MAG TPA: hypothetical protein VFN78_03935, partial [Ktedonobacterales bacterium]|nr:hypothetical protein [Ktedonobacterales bacterium]